MIYCNNCGQALDDNATVCSNCGKPVEKPSQPKGQPVPPIVPNGRRAQEMSIIDACKSFWMKYADFEGRARRAEFWWSYLMVFVLSTLLSWTAIVPLACIIPLIAVSVRRMHDIGKSGWYVLLFLIPFVGTILMIVWFVREGDIGPNEYGEDPKYLK